MSTRTKEVGGGPATGLAGDLVQWLSQGLNTGTFGTGTPAGADAYGATRGISGVLNDMLAGGSGQLGGAFADMITRQSDRDVLGLRGRFGVGGGTAFGTGAQYAEGLLRSETAPKLVQAAGGLQQGALQMLLPLFANIAGKGITQRSTVAEPHPLVSAIGALAPIIGTGLSMYGASRGLPPVGGQGGPTTYNPAPLPTGNFGITPFVQGEWDWMRGNQTAPSGNPMLFDPAALARLFAGLSS